MRWRISSFFLPFYQWNKKKIYHKPFVFQTLVFFFHLNNPQLLFLQSVYDTENMYNRREFITTKAVVYFVQSLIDGMIRNWNVSTEHRCIHLPSTECHSNIQTSDKYWVRADFSVLKTLCISQTHISVENQVLNENAITISMKVEFEMFLVRVWCYKSIMEFHISSIYYQQSCCWIKRAFTLHLIQSMCFSVYSNVYSNLYSFGSSIVEVKNEIDKFSCVGIYFIRCLRFFVTFGVRQLYVIVIGTASA